MSTMKKFAKAVIPKPVRKSINSTLRRMRPQTVSEGWDRYARISAGGDRDHMGDQWNTPERFGIKGVTPEQYLPYLDERLFRPFLGESIGTMVEIGPGGGRFTAMLLDRCDKVYAADTSKGMLKLLRQRFSGDNRVETMLLDGSGLPLVANNSVDVVISWGVFVHLQHWDIYNYLAEIKRVLKPGGKSLIQHSNMVSSIGWEKFMRDLPTSLNRHKRPGSFIVNTPELMRLFAERAGLEVVRQDVETVPRDCVTLLRAP